MSDEIKPDERASTVSTNAETGRASQDSFKDEVRNLMAGLGWGIRWLGVSLAWGGCLFAFLALIGHAIWGGQIANPGPYYGLIVVTGLLTLILSIVRRRI